MGSFAPHIFLEGAIMNIIFDLYGTLMNIHTDEDRASFWSKFAKKMNKYKEYNAQELRK